MFLYEKFSLAPLMEKIINLKFFFCQSLVRISVNLCDTRYTQKNIVYTFFTFPQSSLSIRVTRLLHFNLLLIV